MFLTVRDDRCNGSCLPEAGHGVVSAAAVPPGCVAPLSVVLPAAGLIRVGCGHVRWYSWIAHMFASGSSKKQ